MWWATPARRGRDGPRPPRTQGGRQVRHAALVSGSRGRDDVSGRPGPGTQTGCFSRTSLDPTGVPRAPASPHRAGPPAPVGTRQRRVAPTALTFDRPWPGKAGRHIDRVEPGPASLSTSTPPVRSVRGTGPTRRAVNEPAGWTFLNAAPQNLRSVRSGSGPRPRRVARPPGRGRAPGSSAHRRNEANRPAGSIEDERKTSIPQVGSFGGRRPVHE